MLESMELWEEDGIIFEISSSMLSETFCEELALRLLAAGVSAGQGM